MSCAGVNGEYRLMIAVADDLSLKTAREKLGGDTYKGLKVHWMVQKPVATDAARPAPVPAPVVEVKPKSSTRRTEADYGCGLEADCDIVRDHLRLKPVQHPAGDGRSWIPCAIVLRSVTGSGGGHSFSYAKHRPDCPIRLGRVGSPGYNDYLVEWLIKDGMGEPVRAGITYPFELTASDKAWASQVQRDIEGRRKFVHAGEGDPPPPSAKPAQPPEGKPVATGGREMPPQAKTYRCDHCNADVSESDTKLLGHTPDTSHTHAWPCQGRVHTKCNHVVGDK